MASRVVGDQPPVWASGAGATPLSGLGVPASGVGSGPPAQVLAKHQLEGAVAWA